MRRNLTLKLQIGEICFRYYSENYQLQIGTFQLKSTHINLPNFISSLFFTITSFYLQTQNIRETAEIFMFLSC